MQRAAASASHGAALTSSPLPPNSPRDLNGHPAKRQKLSSSLPQSPDYSASTPRSLYQSDDPVNPFSQEIVKSFRQQVHGGNEAETPWVLNTSNSTGVRHEPSPPQEKIPPHDAIIGRRIFGDFKKRAIEQADPTRGREKDDSLSSGDSDEDYEQYGETSHRRTFQNVKSPKGKRRHDQDDDRMDKVNLKKSKSSGISASSSMRKRGFAGKQYKDKQKG